ncbi:hypothetical protein QBC36DRAFT_38391 [Triangularia setosa]|uniref:Uncharacterized protein n=1 Tax=Triangularia setosa TaxID=2587417 RepID=A0AAN7A6W2_9PEZI|nr:hypothetical protein QBC36DRAFT_38391 [Podospora setosa]
MLCQVVQVGLNIWMNADLRFARNIEYLQPAIYHIFFAARTFQNITDILLFVTFVELGGGFVFCLNGGQKTTSRRYMRYAAFLWAAVLLTLAVTLLAIRTEADTTYVARMMDLHPIGGPWISSSDHEAWQRFRYSVEDVERAYLNQLTKTSRLHNTLNICLWITSFPTLGFGSFALHKSKENIMLKKAATLYLVSTVLTFCRLLVTMAIYINEYSSYPILRFNSYVAYTDIVTPILPIIEAFFNFVLMFIVLTLLFIIVIRKRRGLWSNSQMTWDASNKLANVTTGPSLTSESSPCYSDDGLQEHGFCLQPQQAESSSLPTEPRPIPQSPSSSAVSPSPAPPQQPPTAGHRYPEPVSQHGQHAIPRRPLAPLMSRSPSELGSPSPTAPSLQESHPSHGGFMRRQRTLEELDAQKVLLPDGPSIRHRSQRVSSDDDEGVADGFQMQNRSHFSTAQRETDVVATGYQTAQSHDPLPEEGTGVDMVANGFQMQNEGSAQQRREGVAAAAKVQKMQSHEKSVTDVTESDLVADGFQRQNEGPSELPSYAEAGGETTTTRAGFGYLREKDDQDKKARGRARSF